MSANESTTQQNFQDGTKAVCTGKFITSFKKGKKKSQISDITFTLGIQKKNGKLNLKEEGGK